MVVAVHGRKDADPVAKQPFVAAVMYGGSDAATFGALRDSLRARTSTATIVSGDDQFAQVAFRSGADGAVSAIASIAVTELLAMRRAAGLGLWNVVSEIDERLAPLIRAVYSSPRRRYRARIKHVLASRGAIAAALVRPPLLDLDEDERTRMAHVAQLFANADSVGVPG
jgi:dihydrodipicolinate synthase/N-acetylneuraminate lyase